MKPAMTRREICYPTPETKTPVRGTRYYVPSMFLDSMIAEFLWSDDALDRLHFARGLVHLNAKNALLHAKELIGTEKSTS